MIVGVAREVGVGEGVVSHLVAGEHGSADECRIAFDKAPGHEEGDLEIQLLQEIEELGGSVG